MSKITPRQREVIEKMKEGWKLLFIENDWWLFRKGDIAKISGSTVGALRVKGLIKSWQVTTIDHELTSKGEDI